MGMSPLANDAISLYMLSAGVSRTNCGRYQAELHIGETMKNLGVFDTAEEAAWAHDRYLGRRIHIKCLDIYYS